MTNLRKVVKNSQLYALTMVLTGGSNLLLLPLYTRLLTPHEYGTVTVLLSVQGFLGIVFLLGFHSCIAKFYVDFEDEPQKLRQLLGTITITLIITSVSFITLFVIFHPLFLSVLLEGIDFYPYVFITVLTVGLNAIFLIYQTLLRVQDKALTYSVNALGLFLLKTVIGLSLVIFLDAGALGIVLANFVASIVLFVRCFRALLPQMEWTLNRVLLFEVSRYGFPLLFHVMGSYITLMVDRIFLNNLISASTAGIYEVGYNFALIVSVVVSAVTQAGGPWALRKIKQAQQALIVQSSQWVIAFFGFLALSVSLFAPEIVTLCFPKQYHSAVKLVPFLCFTFVLNGLYCYFSLPLFYHLKGTKYISLGTAISTAINLTLNYFWIPKYGILGAAAASVTAVFAQSVAMYVFSFRVQPIAFPCVRLYGIIALFFILSQIPQLAHPFSPQEFFMFKFIFWVSLAALLIGMKRFIPAELSKAWS